MIDPATQSKIQEILKIYRGFTPIEIAQNLNIQIVETNVDDPDFDGAIKKYPTGEVIIYVRQDSPPNRKLFTIAHELGHFFLHTEEISKGIISYRHAALYIQYNEEQRKREEQANNFAAEILMPEKIFREFYAKNSNLKKDDLIKTMADFFGVSEDAIKVRMSYLDLINF